MNRFEQHMESQHWGPKRPLNFDACAVQIILKAHSLPDRGECAAWDLARAMGRHFYRQTSQRRLYPQPVNPRLTDRLRNYAFRKQAATRSHEH